MRLKKNAPSEQMITYYISMKRYGRTQQRRLRRTGRRTRTKRRSKPTLRYHSEVGKGTETLGLMRRGGTNKYPAVVVVGKIFSNNCIHCTAMAKDWDNLKLMHPTLITDETDIEASEIDTKLPALKAKYNIDNIKIEGYPIIYKIIKSQNGSCYVVLYEDGEPRTTLAMDKWISTKMV